MSAVHHLTGPTLVLPVGPAAAGKSTLLRAWLRDGSIDEVVSTDAIRAELGLDAAETARAYAEARRRIASGLAAGRVVAVDATNLRPDDRRILREVAAAGGAQVVAVRVAGSLTLPDLVARDAGRPRHVPTAVIAEQLALYRSVSSLPRLRDEGYALVAEATDVTLARCGATCTSGCGALAADRQRLPEAVPA